MSLCLCVYLCACMYVCRQTCISINIYTLLEFHYFSNPICLEIWNFGIYRFLIVFVSSYQCVSPNLPKQKLPFYLKDKLFPCQIKHGFILGLKENVLLTKLYLPQMALVHVQQGGGIVAKGVDIPWGLSKTNYNRNPYFIIGRTCT